MFSASHYHVCMGKYDSDLTQDLVCMGFEQNVRRANGSAHDADLDAVTLFS